MARNKKSKVKSGYVRSSIFGVQDSLVSTTGVIAGVAVGSSDKKIVVLAGAVAIAVEAISMAAGEFVSDDAETAITRHSDSVNPYKSAVIMFFSYLIAGFIPLLPILIFPGELALVVCVVAAAIGLFILGVAKGIVTRQNAFKNGLQVLVVGGVAAAIGILVGRVLKI